MSKSPRLWYSDSKLEPVGPAYLDGTEQIVLANLYNLFPAMELEEMKRNAFWCSQNEQMAISDLRLWRQRIADATVSDAFDTLLAQKGQVFATFHYGSYRLVAPLLMLRGRKVTLVVDANVAAIQANEFASLVDSAAKQGHVAKDALRIRSLGDANLVLGMARDLKMNRDLVLYADVNRGNHDLKVDQRAFNVPFLSGTVRSRAGIATIASLTASRIVVVEAPRGEDFSKIKFKFSRPFCVKKIGSDRFSEVVSSEIWSRLAKLVSRDPSQWEALRYLHEYFNPANEQTYAKKDRALNFDRRRYALKVNNEVGEIFDRRNFTVTKVNGDLLLLL